MLFSGREVARDQATSYRRDRQEYCSDGDRQEGTVQDGRERNRRVGHRQDHDETGNHEINFI